MKKHFLALIVMLVLILGASRLKGQTVYITDSGKKYHAKNCSVAKTGKKGINLKDAKKQGYEACKVCKADAIKEENEKPKPEKITKEKNTESTR